MITTQSIKVNAANPEIPLQTFRAFRGSPSSVRVIDVPRKLGEWEITGVSVSVQYPNGRIVARPCVRSGSCWVVTLGGTDVTGVTEGGYTIEASGKDETGADVSGYVLGCGDVEIMALDTSAHPDVAGWVVRLLDAEPEDPRRGDMITVDGTPQLYDGENWITFGGGGSVVESEDNPGYAANADYATDAETANTANVAGRADNDGDGNNILQTYARANELQVRMTLVEAAGGTLQVMLGDVGQTFEQIKAYAETRNAVIIHGRGTYRPTYVSASEMMWDCTGTVAGKVQTGVIHIFASGEVVQLVPAKELALQTSVDDVAKTASYAMTAVQGQLLDRTVNIIEAPTVLPAEILVLFPVRTGSNARDFVVRVKPSAIQYSITFPADVEYETDQDDCWTAEVGKANEWYFSESEPGLFKVIHKALERVAQ